MRWESFSDKSYYDLACVRPEGERRFGCSLHLHSSEEGKMLADFLTKLDAPNPWGPTGLEAGAEVAPVVTEEQVVAARNVCWARRGDYSPNDTVIREMLEAAMAVKVGGSC